MWTSFDDGGTLNEWLITVIQRLVEIYPLQGLVAEDWYATEGGCTTEWSVPVLRRRWLPPPPHLVPQTGKLTVDNIAVPESTFVGSFCYPMGVLQLLTHAWHAIVPSLPVAHYRCRPQQLCASYQQ